MPQGPMEDWREILIVDAALESGLLAAVEARGALEGAAASAGLDERATRIVAAALTDLGYLTSSGGLTSAAERLLHPGPGDGEPGGGVALLARMIRSHARLGETLTTGRKLDDVSSGDAATRRTFARAMRDRAADRVETVVHALPPPGGGGALLDVGGAPGSYALPFAAAGWDVTVLDLPEAVDVLGDELAAAGIAAISGDLLEGLPAGPWDAVYLGNVTHLFDAVTAGDLVRRAGESVRPGGRLAVQEVVRGLSTPGHLFAVTMLLATDGGDTHTEADYRAWMGAGGCPVERVVELSGGDHHLLLGTRAA